MLAQKNPVHGTLKTAKTCHWHLPRHDSYCRMSKGSVNGTRIKKFSLNSGLFQDRWIPVTVLLPPKLVRLVFCGFSFPTISLFSAVSRQDSFPCLPTQQQKVFIVYMRFPYPNLSHKRIKAFKDARMWAWNVKNARPAKRKASWSFYLWGYSLFAMRLTSLGLLSAWL